MFKKESTDILQADTAADDIAVKVDAVSKSFTQWHRKEGSKNLFQLEIFQLEKKIVTAIDNVSFQIKRGEFAAYAGPNGAGKSTTMKLLSGMLKPTGGKHFRTWNVAGKRQNRAYEKTWRAVRKPDRALVGSPGDSKL